jgi:hypothetical protein
MACKKNLHYLHTSRNALPINRLSQTDLEVLKDESKATNTAIDRETGTQAELRED